MIEPYRLLVLALLLPCGAAFAEQARAPAGGQSAQLQQMIARLNQEKVALAAENGRLKQDLRDAEEQGEKAEKALKKERAATAGLKQQLSQSNAQGDATKRSFDELKERFETLVTQYRATVEVLRGVEGKASNLSEQVSDYAVRVKQCEDNNETMYTLNLELLDRYETKGFFDSIAQAERFTGLRRARVQNMMDDYRYLSEDMRLKYEGDTNDEAPEPQDAEESG